MNGFFIKWFTTVSFYKQLAYKQLTLEWQITKYVSGFRSLSVSNNKNYRLTKIGVFPF